MQALFIWESEMSDLVRIEELEIRFVHQEQVVAELNEMITAQWKRIEGLESHLKRLHEELQNMDQPRGGPEQKPPHY